MNPTPQRRTSVYVHFPWCEKRCPYCDFVTYRADKDSIPQQRYTDALLREFDARIAALEPRVLHSVFLGGGTPSLWDPPQVGRLLKQVRGAFSSADTQVEITMECNPSSFSAERAKALIDAGINRISLGVQSLTAQHLNFLGRLHSADDALAAVDVAAKHFNNVNADFIFGMPDQSLDRFAEELRMVLDAGVSHISAYALTIEKNTPFGKLAQNGQLRVADEQLYADLFLRARQTLTDQGLTHYEVSNYAQQGRESIHNAHYWQGGDYLGIGVGAVGKISTAHCNGTRWKNTPRVEQYLNWQTLNDVQHETETLGAESLLQEAIMLGLRTERGCNTDEIKTETGLDLLSERRSAIAGEVAKGNVVLDAPWVRIPRSRWLYTDAIVRSIF